jgi:hypothetical protein
LPTFTQAEKISTEAQAILPPNKSSRLEVMGIKWAQKIIGNILYFAQAIYMTVLMALSSIAVEQIKATEQNMSCCRQLLDYLSGYSDAKIHFCTSNMILNIHLDASYLSEEKKLQPRAGLSTLA